MGLWHQAELLWRSVPSGGIDMIIATWFFQKRESLLQSRGLGEMPGSPAARAREQPYLPVARPVAEVTQHLLRVGALPPAFLVHCAFSLIGSV